MKKIVSIATISFQILTTFVVLFIIYFIFALLDIMDYDFPNMAGFLIFQPLFGLLLCALTIVICIIIGLPVRLIQKLHGWWSRRPYIIFSGVMIGFVFLLASLLSTRPTNIMIGEEQKIKQVPNITLALTGWFLIAFCLLHFYPLAILNRIRTRLISRQTDNKKD